MSGILASLVLAIMLLGLLWVRDIPTRTLTLAPVRRRGRRTYR